MFKVSTKHPFILVVFFSMILSFSANVVSAAPSINGISGSIIHGQSVSISGSGFGVKSPAAPLVWNNHEACISNSDILTCNYNDEGSDGSKAYIKTDRAYGVNGTKSARMDYATNKNSMFPRIGNNISGGALEVYATYQTFWTRYAGTGSVSPIFKWSRGGANPPYSGVPRFYETIRPESNGSINLDGGFDTGFVTSSGTTWVQNEAPWVYYASASANQWNRAEYHYKLSNPAGTANGAFETWINSVKNVNQVNRVTRLSSESSSKIDYVMTPFDGNDSYGTSNGYYFWIDDVYIDTTLSRIEICAGSTWANRGACEIQIPTAWDASGTAITATINQGAIPTSSSRYLFVVDSSGSANTNGYAITFGNIGSTTPIADTTAPTSTISAPLTGATVNGSQAVTVTASDNVGIAKVELYIDGSLINSLNTSPYSFTWNTATVANGSHTLSAKAYDAAGNVGQSSSVNVTVNNLIADTTAPTVLFSSPTASATITGNVSGVVTATDNIGVTKVEIYVDSLTSPIATATATPYVFTWNSGAVANGSHTLTAKAYDAAGNTKNATISVLVNNALLSGTYSATFGNVTGADYPNTVQDTFININADVNASNTSLETYTWPAATPANAILMKWNLSAIPANAVIQSATLYLYMDHLSDTGGDALFEIPVHQIINKSPVISSATGYTYDGTNSWTANSAASGGVPLAQADIGSVADAPLINTVFGYKTWNVTSIVSDWVKTPTNNTGMLLNSSNKATSDSNRGFASSESSDPDKRPKLVINYTLGVTAPKNLMKVTP